MAEEGAGNGARAPSVFMGMAAGLRTSTELSRRRFLGAAAALLGERTAGAAEAPRGCLSTLVSRYPRFGAELPHVSLGRFPTPVAEVPALGERVGVKRLWVKRDDLSGSYGGGKTRKLEALLGEARARGAERVVTFGGFGSNQCVAVAHYAGTLGLESELYVLAERKSEHAKANLRAMLSLASSVEAVGSVAEGLRRMRKRHRAKRHQPYVIPVGGSSALGCVPFVAAAFELAEQVERGELETPDVVVVAGGTLGTAAGLGIGLSALGWPTEVRAVRASSPTTSSRHAMDRLTRDTRRWLVEREPGFPVAAAVRVSIDGSELGGGYAVPTARGRRARELAEEHAGLTLEATYTAKALAAVMRSAALLANKRVLFWHSAHAGPLHVPLTEQRVPAAFRAFLR